MTDQAGLSRLIDLLYAQEAFHQRVLQLLFAETDLARRLELWDHAGPPNVLYEPLRGLFDLALAIGDEQPEVLIELKIESELDAAQMERQESRAASTTTAYLLLGGTYFRWRQTPNLRVIGLPDLATAVRQVAEGETGVLHEIAGAYARRLESEAERWTRPLPTDRAAWTGFDFFRFYQQVAAAWPVPARIYPVTNRGGQQWVLNPDAWRTPAIRGWEVSTLYWEVINSRTRFKIGWTGDRRAGAIARDRFAAVLERAAAELGVQINRPRRGSGKFMTALELAGDTRDDVLVDGAVSAERAASLYERASRLFSVGVTRIPEEPPGLK